MGTTKNEMHKMYMAHSPEYRRTVNSWGRMLAPKYVIAILKDHSLVEDYQEDVLGIHTYPAETDAAALYAWLGY